MGGACSCWTRLEERAARGGGGAAAPPPPPVLVVVVVVVPKQLSLKRTTTLGKVGEHEPHGLVWI
jgi:hypothetical protein